MAAGITLSKSLSTVLAAVLAAAAISVAFEMLAEAKSLDRLKMAVVSASATLKEILVSTRALPALSVMPVPKVNV